MRISVRLLHCLVLLLCGVSCTQQDTATNSGAKQIEATADDPTWISQATPHNKVAVVFVHGIFGGTKATWTNANGHSFFEFVKQAPDIGGKVDVYAFGFTSKMFQPGSLNIREAATKLDEYLTYSKVWDYDAVVFVAHSMGGLVVMRLLTSRPNRLEQVPLVAMFATPQEGAQIAAIGRLLLSNNAALAQMVPADGNDFLQGLDEDWKLIPQAKRPAVVCAYETVPTYHVPIVSSVSATRYCDSAPSAIGGADHLSIVKPDRPEHESVVKLVNALQTYVFGKDQVLLETPDFELDGNKWVYRVHDTHTSSARLINRGRRTIQYVIGPPSGSKLSVLPTTPRDIAPGQQDSISLSFLYWGDWKKEYDFKLSAPIFGERMVAVVLDSIPTNDARERDAATAVADAVTTYLKSPSARELETLEPEEKREKLVTVAQEAVRSREPNAPPEMTLMLTADALSLSGLTKLSETALRRLEREDPKAVALASTQALAAQVSAQDQAPSIFVGAKTPTPAEIGLGWSPRSVLLDSEKHHDLSNNLSRLKGFSEDNAKLQVLYRPPRAESVRETSEKVTSRPTDAGLPSGTQSAITSRANIEPPRDSSRTAEMRADRRVPRDRANRTEDALDDAADKKDRSR